MARAADFARITLQLPPTEYDQKYFRDLNGRLEDLISSRLGRGETPTFAGGVYTRVTGTNAAQAIVITTDTVVQFDTLVRSQDDLITFQPSTFNFLVHPKAEINLSTQIRTNGTTGTCLVKVRRNGVVDMALNLPVRTGGDLVATFPISAEQGDVFDVVVNVSNAQTLDLTKSSFVVTRLSADPRLVTR